ncbi:MAG: hypothetical protein HY832_03700, partial [Candidatus Aenigmarchaeota archaeon]|nr:hypothetical protein [Candidatus Aenigmarchaeota archaeon]
ILALQSALPALSHAAQCAAIHRSLDVGKLWRCFTLDPTDHTKIGENLYAPVSTSF